MAPPKKKPTFTPPPPPPPPEKKGPKYLGGLPDDYTVPGGRVPAPFRGNFGAPSTYQGPPQTPRYFEGMEFIPASFSPEKIAMLQRELATAGLIGPKTKFRVGLWDETTRNAYKNLLEYANASGTDERTAIKRYAQAQVLDPSGEEGPTRAPLTIKKSNPTDLYAIADVAARSKLGRKLTDKEKAAMASAFQAQEVAEQTTDYNQAETGGTSVGGPSAQAFMAERIAKDYGVEAGAHDLAGQFGEFGDLLNQVGG